MRGFVSAHSLAGCLLCWLGSACGPDSMAPSVTTRSATALGLGAMTANGAINPHGLSTTYHFEYGPTDAYGFRTRSDVLPPKLRAYYRESWDEGLGGWQTWGLKSTHRADGGHASGYVNTAGPASLNDFNHEMAGVLHQVMYLYPGPIQPGPSAGGRSSSVHLGGGDPDFRDAKIAISVRGRDWRPSGSEFVWWTQSQSNIRLGDGAGFKRANWAYSGFTLTDYLLDGLWHRVEYRLRNESSSWTAPAVLRGARRERRPNILLILADDLGYSDLGCFGSEIPTPHLDGLARRGLRFTQFYNGAVCCPTRAALLTGLYPHQAGMGWMVLHGSDSRPPGPYQGWLNDRCVTIAEVLKGAGYRTLMAGKWHVGENRPHWPLDRGFDRYFGLISGGANYFDITKDYLPGIRRQMAVDNEPYDPPREGFYMTDAIADRAVELLAGAETDREPFFFYLAFTAPHCPLHAPPADIARHRGRYRRGWDVLRAQRFARQRAAGIFGPDTVLSPREPAVPPWEEVRNPDLMDLQMAIYAAQVEKMDAGIGRVLAELRRTGRDRDTVVMFLSDNGSNAEGDFRRFRKPELNLPPYLGGPESYQACADGWSNAGSTPFRKYKTYLHEGGICTPLIVAGPGVTTRPGSLCHEPGHIVDLLSTCAELGGASYPARHRGHDILPTEGVSLRPLLQGRSLVRPKPIFWELEGRYAMRDGPWKLLGREGHPWELYDISRDRSELHDLAAAQPERVRAMAAAHEAWARRCGVRSWKQIRPTLVNVPGVG